MQTENNFQNLAVEYSKNPTPETRSRLLAQSLAELKKERDFRDFRDLLRRMENRASLDKRQKRRVVINALKNFVCELGELTDETGLKRAEIHRILKVLIRARLVKVKKRELYLDPRTPHTLIFVWHDLEL